MDKGKVRQLREDIDKALATVAEKHGVKFNVGRITFTDEDFKAQLRCLDLNAANVESALELDWKRHIHKYPMLIGVEIGTRLRVGDEVVVDQHPDFATGLYGEHPVYAFERAGQVFEFFQALDQCLADPATIAHDHNPAILVEDHAGFFAKIQ